MPISDLKLQSASSFLIHAPDDDHSLDLYLIGGTWDIIFWNALALTSSKTLKGRCIVFSRAFSPSQRQQIENASSAAGLIPVVYTNENHLRKIAPSLNINNLFVLHLSDSLTHQLCNQFNYDNLFIGFEGLGGYFPSPKAQVLLARPYTYVHYSNLPPPQWVTTSKIQIIPSSDLAKSIAQLRLLLSIKERSAPLDCNTVLVLGQHFHRHRVLTWDQEHDLYEEFIKEHINEGLCVAWKEHPRNDKPFGEVFFSRYPDRFLILELDPLHSIEFWGSDLRAIRSIAGVCSNSLFNLRDIYGLPAISILTPQSLTKFNFENLGRSALINLVGIACLNHGGHLPIDHFIAAFQRAASKGPPKQTKGNLRQFIFTFFSGLKRTIFRHT